MGPWVDDFKKLPFYFVYGQPFPSKFSMIHSIHRDVKPSNILIASNGTVKMCDFGISGYLVDSVAKTKEAGCKPYMSPERIDVMGSTNYDVKSDVWSLGISMIEIATGKFPYKVWTTPFEQLKQVDWLN